MSSVAIYNVVEHTPGPWWIGKIAESLGKKADAAIISAAPDMYSLLQECLAFLEGPAVGDKGLTLLDSIQQCLLEIGMSVDR